MSGLCQLFREALYKEGFVYMHMYNTHTHTTLHTYSLEYVSFSMKLSTWKASCICICIIHTHTHDFIYIQSGVCQLFREALYKEGFMEIHTPKIVPGERYQCVYVYIGALGRKLAIVFREKFATHKHERSFEIITSSSYAHGRQFTNL
jgi:hypothetical protein